MAHVKIYKSLPHIFALAFTISEIYKFEIVYLEKVGQGRGLRLSQSHHSMANAKIYKCLPHIFLLALTDSDI